MTRFILLLLMAAFATIAASGNSFAVQTVVTAENVLATPTATKTTAGVTGVKRALIACSLPGDETHLEQFKESISLIRSALIEKFGFEEANVRIQFGRNEEDPKFDDLETIGRATKDELLEESSKLVAKATNDDTTWVFLIGHTYYDGKTVFYNVPDVDIKQEEFTSSFEDLKGHSVFFICTPVSGYFIKGLSKPNRIVITSTEADWETNGSIFHTHLAKSLETMTATDEFDIDKDGNVTLVDLYIKSCQDMVGAYLTEGEFPFFPTEHPNLDDNGDGKGSELQINFLTPEQGGQMGLKGRKQKHKDGTIASSTLLPFVSNSSN